MGHAALTPQAVTAPYPAAAAPRGRRGTRVALVLVTVAAAFAVCAARASAYIYWSSLTDNVIERANLDGTGVNPNFLVTGSTSPIGQIAVSGSYIYWTSPESGTIGRAKIDGSSPEPRFVHGLPHPSGLAVGAQFIYFSEEGNGQNGGGIGRVPLAGGTPTLNFVGGLTLPGPLAAANGEIYWNSGGIFGGGSAHVGDAIGEVSQSGTGVDQTLVPEAYGGPAASSTAIYWGNLVASHEPFFGSEEIGRANLDGTGADPTFIPLAQPGIEAAANTLALDSTHLYWEGAGRIGRASLAGGEVNLNLITGIAPSSIAVDELTSGGPGAGSGAAVPAKRGAPSVSSSGVLTLTYAFPSPGTAHVTVVVPSAASLARTASAGYGTATLVVHAAGTFKIVVRPSARVRSALRRGRRIRIRVTLTFSPAGGGAHSTIVSTATLHRG